MRSNLTQIMSMVDPMAISVDTIGIEVNKAFQNFDRVNIID